MRAPGNTLSSDALIEAGWPGENIRVDAALNRLRVALTALRKLGLRDVIKTGDEGHMLDPGVGVIYPYNGDVPR